MIFLPRAYRSHMSDPLTLRPKNTIRFSRPPDLTACHTRGISHPAKKFPRAQRSRGESSARLSVVLAVLHPAGERYGPKGWGQDMCSPSYKQTGGQIKRGSPLPPHAGSHLTCLQFFSVTKYAYAEKQGGPHTLLQEDEQAGRERKPHTLENTDLLSHDAFLGHILPNWYHKDVYCCCRFKRGGGNPTVQAAAFGQRHTSHLSFRGSIYTGFSSSAQTFVSTSIHRQNASLGYTQRWLTKLPFYQTGAGLFNKTSRASSFFFSFYNAWQSC